MNIILASQSLFRAKALEILGLEFTREVSEFDESSVVLEDPLERAKVLAEEKAKVVGKRFEDALIIAADMFVVKDGEILEKPASLDEAKEMLREQSGSVIKIVAGLAVYNTLTKKMLSCANTCDSKWRELSDYEINDYVSRYPVLKCAAAFEGDGAIRFSESVRGDLGLFRVGLSVSKLIEFLRENGIEC